MSNIEDIVLKWDQRGISALRKYLPRDFCLEAARFALQQKGPVMIATGFYVAGLGKGETDGPPGAVGIGAALEKLGYPVYYVTDGHNCELVKSLIKDSSKVVDFPVTDHTESQKFSQDVRNDLEPSLLVSIERVGFGRDGLYRNRLGEDVSHLMAKLDYLFIDQPYTIGIGDGGNEIGMGLVGRQIAEENLPIMPSTTATAQLVVAGVSNWGGYGVVAGLSLLTGQNLLPKPEEEKEWILELVAHGAVDSFTNASTETVDGYSLDENAVILEELHGIVEAGI